MLKEVFSEQQLAEAFKVSKTPVREALNILCQEGFVVRYPSYGYVLKDMTPQEYQNISELRYILESGAARIIISSCTDEEIRQLYDALKAPEGTSFNIINIQYHSKLGQLTKNELLASQISRMAEVTSRPGKYADFTYKSVGNLWHERTIEALLARNLADAVHCIREDLVYVPRNEAEM